MTNTTPETVDYDPKIVEAKWRERWDLRRTDKQDIAHAAKPYFNLMMFPYPSAEGLHVGNVFAFVGADIHGRVRRLQGWDVFEPFGFDAFGIHSENFALKMNTHPGRLIPRNIERFREQLRDVGLMIDWDHELSTTDPTYYRWTQWIFLQLFNAGIAVKKRAPVNWCPECKTVLANEQVIDGFCERHSDTKVHQRLLEQWFFKITDYAERLLNNIQHLDWSDSTRLMQRNWIGKSVGAELDFKTPDGKSVKVYTTRPDTVFGATYVVMAPEHPMAEGLATAECMADVLAYRRAASAKDLVARKVGDREKTGVFTGSYARNPATGESVPIWLADYVLMEYGTGAIMAVPAHDERDFEFAEAFRLPIVRVVSDPDREDALPFPGKNGVLVNSGQFDGMTYEESFPAVTNWLQERALAEQQTRYRIHDWCISRQRYWGPPIPIIYCDACGPVGVPEQDLPVLLPDIEDFRPDDSGVSPLARHEQWYRVPCPKCGADARRETDVSDTFLDSAWYFLRYPSTEFDDRPFDKDVTKRWLPVAQYIGGNEHAVLHLLYSRFVMMVLNDLGWIDFEEPYLKFRAHGTIVRDGAKMSKSRGNVVNPDEYITRWGADTFRMYLMFLGPYQEGGDFRDKGISGIRRFLDRVWIIVHNTETDAIVETTDAIVRKRHQTVRKVTDDVEGLRYNTAISAMMEFLNTIRAESKDKPIAKEIAESLIVLLAPFAPHLAEECWEKLGHDASVFDAQWPEYDDALTVDVEIELVVQVNGKVRQRLQVAPGLSENDARERATADDTVKRFMGGKAIRKTIYVQDRLVNLVV